MSWGSLPGEEAFLVPGGLGKLMQAILFPFFFFFLSITDAGNSVVVGLINWS